METAAAIGPYQSYSDSLKELKWNDFYQSILNKEEGLDKVIYVVENTLDSVNNKNSENIFMDIMQDECYVSNGEIFTHLYRHINQVELSENIPKDNLDTRMRFEWNITSNLLRNLKMIKNNEPTYLLPKGDQEITNNFITKLMFPPVKDHYF
jgi:hypothetical protein